MASKASTILSVSFTDERVTYRPFGYGTGAKTDRFGYLSKVDKVATLKFCGATFGGKSPMHLTLEALTAKWNKIREANINTGTVTASSEPSVPSPVVNEPSPNVKSPVVNGSLDLALRVIVQDVLANYVPEVSPEEVNNLVESTMSPYRVMFDNLADQVTSLQSVVAKSQPKIINVSVNKSEPVTVPGVVHKDFEKVLALCNENLNVYLVGPAGSGKSTIPEQIAQVLGLPFAAQSCGQTDAKFDYVGYRDVNGEYHGTLFREMFENGGVFLLDEMDNASPDMLVTLNQALANGQLACPDRMVKRHPNFRMFGAGNTFGNGATAQFVGRSPQDGAFMDRFTKWVVNVDEDVEDAMIASVGLDPVLHDKWTKVIRDCRRNAESKGLRVMVTPRAAVRGAKMLATQKFTIREAVMSQFGFGLDPVQFDKVTEGVDL